MLEVKKKDNESFEALMRRFSKKLLQSGRIIQAKKIRYHSKPLNKRAQKLKALRKEEINDKREYLRKIGKLDDLIDKRKGNFKKK